MKPESLKALGAIPLDAETARELGLDGLEAEGLKAHLMPPLEQFRRGAPIAAAKIAELAVDNPGQIALITAGSMVAAKMALNLMKPRTAGEAIALFIVLQVALPKLAWAAVEKGWITFRVRDPEGNLIPLIPGKPVS